MGDGHNNNYTSPGTSYTSKEQLSSPPPIQHSTSNKSNDGISRKIEFTGNREEKPKQGTSLDNPNQNALYDSKRNIQLQFSITSLEKDCHNYRIKVKEQEQVIREKDKEIRGYNERLEREKRENDIKIEQCKEQDKRQKSSYDNNLRNKEAQIKELKVKYKRLMDLSEKTTGEYEDRIIKYNRFLQNFVKDFRQHKTDLRTVTELLQLKHREGNTIDQYNQQIVRLREYSSKCMQLRNVMATKLKMLDKDMTPIVDAELTDIKNKVETLHERQVHRDKEYNLLKQTIDGISFNLQFCIQDPRKSTIQKNPQALNEWVTEVEEICTYLKALSR